MGGLFMQVKWKKDERKRFTGQICVLKYVFIG